MNSKRYINLSVLLMFVSAMMIFLAMIYYSLEEKVINYRYSDVEEYNDINEGIKFIEKLPIQFNILNKYFSNINNLSQEDKEQILIAYAVKNRFKQFDCGPSTNTIKYNCVKTEDLNSKELQKIFNMNLTFKNSKINIYIDDYGASELSNKNDKDIYEYVVNITNNKNYRLYTKFDRFKQEKDSYIFYVYQGYINANTSAGEKLSVYDFMTGNPVYTDASNGYNDFIDAPIKNIKNLQKYKYELRKHKDNTYYLYAYNPVKS